MRIDRRRLLLSSGAVLGVTGAARATAADPPQRPPDFAVRLGDGILELTALSDRAMRVRYVPARAAGGAPPSPILTVAISPPRIRRTAKAGVTRLALPFLQCEIDRAGTVRFFDRSGGLLLAEKAGSRRLVPSILHGEPTYEAGQSFEAPCGERLFGTGCFQDGALDLRGFPRSLTQVNTQISQPFLLSSRGYGLLWHNLGMSELNMPANQLVLKKNDSGQAQVVNVTTSSGNGQLARRITRFDGMLSIGKAGRHAFLLDIGAKMASRYHVTIGGKRLVDFANLWLPPTTSFFADLAAGDHHVVVEANDQDAPSLWFGPVQEETSWQSPVADAVDYVVIAGPSADDIMAGYRALIGPTPMMPRWAFGYIHCRERFHSSDEIVDTLAEFRRRKLPVDVMVQDWQYWGRHGWNAMRFDERFYPDPAALVRKLHDMGGRFMLSVWSKIGRETELGKEAALNGFYIDDTEWIDFFNPRAAAFYRNNHDVRLGRLGIDAWWQDATEPENDDLVGRRTAAGAGERVRLLYPLRVAEAVYQERRAAEPDSRPMILTRSAFPGQQRYGAATWSGDIGNDWETLRRQIPAGLNMAASGYPYWTVDAGGFFRPGPGQYDDPAYHERLIRWFQYATFLPLQRVHGYQTNTEFWRYGTEVSRIAQRYLELRYRLHPYIYSMAGETWRKGVPPLRPLVFDFPDDPPALDQTHAYLFGRAFHVAPVLAEGVTEWRAYLPPAAGGWLDFWSGVRRTGGRDHRIPTTLERIPLHLRAGSIVPVGPVIQSTGEAKDSSTELHVVPGADGAFELYEDDGLTNAYERGHFSLIPLRWDDARATLHIGERQGHFMGMARTRSFVVHRAGPGAMPLDGKAGLSVDYSGEPVSLALR